MDAKHSSEFGYPGKDADREELRRWRARLLERIAPERLHRRVPHSETWSSEDIDELLRSCQAILGTFGGKIGGLSRSEAKIAAARENGKRGGRPKGSRNKAPSRKREKLPRTLLEGHDIQVRNIF